MSEFSLYKYATKETLYCTVNRLKRSLGINSYPVNSKELLQCFCKELRIEYIPFSTNDICGILYKGDNSTDIGLNTNRTEDQQNFDCMHEGIHYFSHDISYCKCVCSEKIISQEKAIEYQANEGAAQFLVPYELFIPEVADLFCSELSSFDIDVMILELAKKYKVSDAVITVRLRSLKYEISQYVHGVPIDKIRILSDSRQKQEGIQVKSIMDIRDQKYVDMLNESFWLDMNGANVYAI